MHGPDRPKIVWVASVAILAVLLQAAPAATDGADQRLRPERPRPVRDADPSAMPIGAVAFPTLRGDQTDRIKRRSTEFDRFTFEVLALRHGGTRGMRDVPDAYDRVRSAGLGLSSGATLSGTTTVRGFASFGRTSRHTALASARIGGETTDSLVVGFRMERTSLAALSLSYVDTSVRQGHDPSTRLMWGLIDHRRAAPGALLSLSGDGPRIGTHAIGWTANYATIRSAAATGLTPQIVGGPTERRIDIGFRLPL